MRQSEPPTTPWKPRPAYRLTVPLVALSTLLLGVVLAFSGDDLEARFGLPLLFNYRSASTEDLPVAIVAMNHTHGAHKTLGLPYDYERWPREYHAQIVDKLTAAGAKVIGFDVIFGVNPEQSVASDRAFEAALRRSQRVVLGVKVEQKSKNALERTGSGDELSPLTALSHDDHLVLTQGQCIDPLPSLRKAAVTTAPFQLPPQASRVDNFWTFLDSPCESPSLPAAILQVYARDVVPRFLAELQRIAPAPLALAADPFADVNKTMLELRDTFVRNPELHQKLALHLQQLTEAGRSAAEARLLEGLLNLYRPGANAARMLNFYGPALTIPTYEFGAVYSTQPDTPKWANLERAVKGKAIFVGASEADIEDQKNTADAFSTVFDEANGMRLQGVEIAATAFLNLLYGNSIQRLPSAYTFLLIAGHSGLLALLWSLFNIRKAAIFSGVVLIAYIVLAEFIFGRYAWWLPVISPGIQTLVGASSAWLARYLEAARERSDLVRAVRKRLPPGVATNYVITGQIRHTVYGVCLATDIGGWTKLASQLSEEVLSDLMRAYYLPLFTSVEQNEGYIVDIAGDGMLAIWVEEDASPEQRREHACRGALAIDRVVAAFNASSSHTLHTRLGLHWGKLVLRDIGDIDEFALKAFGLAVNTASRIENLNKWLNTRLLASAETTAGLHQFLWRPVGAFQMEGLDVPLELFELVSLKSQASPAQLRLCTLFADAMVCYRNRELIQAQRYLNEVLDLEPDDGPAKFYLDMLERIADDPPAPELWSGAITAPKAGPTPTARL